jgi:large subunit ribosomal protein L10
MGTRESKQQIVAEIKEKLSKASSVILTDYRGLNVAEITELRSILRDAGVEYKVAKNTLTLIAARDSGLEDLEKYLEGPTALAFGMQDPVAPAKLLSKFAKTHKNLEIKGGVLEGQVIDIEGVKNLADLPPREVLLAQVFAGMKAPISGIVNVLSGNLRNLVYVLDAIKEQKGA